ncbi:MAG: alpha/beta hydrolase [Pseudomonadota bacterium]
MTQHSVKINDELTLAYEMAGEGAQDILMLPGWTMSTRVFEHQLAFFENSDRFRFITFDPRAHGRSSKTENGHFYAQHGRDLNAFVEALGLKNFILGGWSFGTLAVLSYVNQFGSDRLDGLLMLDGPPRASGVDNQNEWVTYRYDDADGSNQFFTYSRLENVEHCLREFGAWMLEAVTEERLEWISRISLETPATAAALLNASAAGLDYDRDLQQLEGKIPLCYVMCESRRRVAENWKAEYTPSARVEGFGEHLMFWERPDQFNRVLQSFAESCIRE